MRVLQAPFFVKQPRRPHRRSWITLFTQRSAGFSAFVSVAIVSIFYVALTICRFVCALVAERLEYATTLRLLAIGITVTYPLVVLGSHALLVVGGVFCAGLSLSGLYPTTRVDGARRYPGQTGTVTGTLSIALTLGSMAPPQWTGVIAGLADLQMALGVNYGMVLLLLALAWYLSRNHSPAWAMQPLPGNTL